MLVHGISTLVLQSVRTYYQHTPCGIVLTWAMLRGIMRDILFYFFDFISEPVGGALCINAFRDVLDSVTKHTLQGVLVYFIFFCLGCKEYPRIVRTVCWVKVRGEVYLIRVGD